MSCLEGLNIFIFCISGMIKKLGDSLTMALLHCKTRVVWLLSICIGNDRSVANAGLFHFRGYLHGHWVTKVWIISDLEEFSEWQLGETYLLKIEVREIDARGKLIGFLLAARNLGQSFGKDWEEY